MSSVVHFEIPADDVERASKFYNMLFNWKPEKVPGPYEYWMLHTKKTESDFGINGGISRRKSESEHIIDYIEVDSIENYLRKVESLGGKVVEKKTAIHKMGWFAICLDTEKNTFGLWETDENAK
ncbi:MAG: glyoxalase [Planctomycetes bacterium GWF2_41_51]|nr:MAG: glyoxalase [Planctomycetes bacterium GWF2_41_51]HBG25851.1 glyoxalase [Phycisphaerales bacterium]